MLTYPQFFLYRIEYTVAIILVISNPPIHQNPGLKSSQKIPGLQFSLKKFQTGYWMLDSSSTGRGWPSILYS